MHDWNRVASNGFAAIFRDAERREHVPFRASARTVKRWLRKARMMLVPLSI